MTDSSPASLAIGDVLAGKYRILRLLGRGGMGAVYAAEHRILGQEVAIKVLLDQTGRGANVVQRFVNEARAAARIQGEHVVRVFDVDTSPDGNLFIAMELLQGEDLDSMLEKVGTLEPTVAVDYVLQAMESLAQAHQLGIVHRDLKPSNLFVVIRADGEHVIKVLDFGVAKVRNMPNVDGESTHTTALFGTPHYMSPEQIRGAKAADAQSDLWSVGVILFKLLTGAVPFSGETFGELCFAVATQTAPLVHSLRPNVPEALGLVVARCLERDKEKRYRTAAELAVALRPFASPDGARSVDRVVATERGAASGTATALSSDPTSNSAPAESAVAPASRTAGNWAASQATSQGPAALLRVLFVVLAACAVAITVAAVLLVRAQSPKSSGVTAEPSAAVSGEPTPSAGATKTVPAAIPLVPPSATPSAPSASASASPALGAPSSPASASKPATQPPPRPARGVPPVPRTPKPASSGGGIVTDQGWN